MVAPPSDKAPKPGLNIYGCQAVNPYKLTIALEELGVPYNYINMELTANDHKSDWYLAINPNGRAPAVVHVKDDGNTHIVFESGACLLYIVNEFDKEHKISYPFGTPEHWTQLSWLSWQVASYGPMMAQASHFNRYTPEPVPYGSWRYTSECRRLHHALDKQLATHPFVAGDRLTIADIAIFIFAHSSRWCGLDVHEFPHLEVWKDKLAKRPAFQRGLNSPAPYAFSDEAVTNPDNQEFLNKLRKMGTQFIKQATEQWSKGDPMPVPSDHSNFEG